MLRQREYVRVNVELKDKEFSITPDRKDVIEANDNIDAKGVYIDDVIKALKKKPNSSALDRDKFDR